ncbi:MAG: type II toxin-antitoxin system RelB/DinJ family antitoxin [Candidatus Gastranaerophilales bacterium]
MSQSNISIRIDDTVKQKFDALCEELGLSMSTAINIFVKTVIRENRIPFDISLNTPNCELKKAIYDVENKIGLSKQFDSAEAAIKSMLED